MITLLLIYNLFVAPYVLVFMDVYEWCEKGTEILAWSDDCETKGGKFMRNETLYRIELAFDIIFLMEIILNFFKRSRTEPTL
jgi:hypothetical protein